MKGIISTSLLVLALASSSSALANQATIKAQYLNIVSAAWGLKPDMAKCIKETGDPEKCAKEQDKLHTSIYHQHGLINAIVFHHGAITIVPNDYQGIKHSDTYTLTPVVHGNYVSWKSSGGGVQKGYAK